MQNTSGKKINDNKFSFISSQVAKASVYSKLSAIPVNTHSDKRQLHRNMAIPSNAMIVSSAITVVKSVVMVLISVSEK